MKSELEKLEGLTRRLKVEIPPEAVESALDNMYKEVQRVAKFKGFRPGKAPMTLVKTHYKQKVESDVASQIVQEHFEKALGEHSLVPVNYPDIELDAIEEGKALRFSATFEVRPDVPLKTYKGLELEKEKVDVRPEVIDGILEDIRKNKATMVPLFENRPAQVGDVAVIDFHGRVGGKDLPGGAGKEHLLELGSQQFIPGFEEGVVGMTPGQNKVIALKFPEDYHIKETAGKEVEFEVNLLELKRKKLPDLDDEFAKSLGQHTSLNHLREEIQKDVISREEKRVKDDLKNRLLHELVSKNQFQVPKSMLAEQKKILIDDVHHRMKDQGMKHDQFEEYAKKWDKDFDLSAEFVIRSSLLVNAIAKQENLFSTDADFQTKIDDYAKQSGIELEKIKAFYSKPENKSRLRFQMTEERVINFLIENAKITEVAKEAIKKVDDGG